MSEERSWLDYYTSPWLGLGLLLIGLGLGSWAPSLVGPVQSGVETGIGWLVDAAPYVILFTVLPALLALFDTAGGRAPVVVLGLFAASSITAGLFGLVSAGLVFQLPLTGGGGGGFIDVLGQRVDDNVGRVVLADPGDDRRVLVERRERTGHVRGDAAGALVVPGDVRAAVRFGQVREGVDPVENGAPDADGLCHLSLSVRIRTVPSSATRP
jgi:hypothetical protein